MKSSMWNRLTDEAGTTLRKYDPLALVWVRGAAPAAPGLVWWVRGQLRDEAGVW